MPGSRWSVRTRSTSSALRVSSASSPLRDGQDLVALQLEGPVQRAAGRPRHPRRAGLAASSGSPPPPGSEIADPRPPPRGALSTRMSPPCRSTIFLTMAMPRPVPGGLGGEERQEDPAPGPRTSMPTPLSVTSNTTAPSRPLAGRPPPGRPGAPLDRLQRVLHDVREDLPEPLAVDHRDDDRSGGLTRQRDPPAPPRRSEPPLHHGVEDARDVVWLPVEPRVARVVEQAG